MYPDRNALDVAWAAGLFEGEGCMNGSHRGKRGSGAQLRLGMTDRDVVERFASIIGAGNIHKPRDDSARGNKPVYTWCLYEAAEVTRVIETLLPYFGARRTAKALEVLAIARDIDVHKGKRTCCPAGHPYDGDNLRIEHIVRNGRTYEARRCRACRREQGRNRSKGASNG